MPYIETVEDLVDALADTLGIYNQSRRLENPEDEGSNHLDFCGCRLCWCGRMERRIRTAVGNEQALRMACGLTPPPLGGEETRSHA